MTTPVFTYQPNWAIQPVESLEWLTDVQTAHDGTEVRRQVRISPRRALSFAVTLTTAEMQRFDAWLHQHQVADVIMPVWTDGYRLPSAGDSSTTFAFELIDVPGADLLDYKVGGRLVVVHGDGSTSVRTVTSVEAGNVTFSSGGTVTWAAGDRIYPGRLSRLTSSIDVERVTAGVVNVSIVARFIDDTSLDAGAWPTEYRGVPVLDLQPNRVSPVAASLSRITTTIDYAIGKWRRFDRAGRAFSARAHEYVLNGRAEIDAFRRFLHGRDGRFGTFWCPNWQADLTIRSISGTSLVIDTIGWAAAYGVDYVGRQDIMLRLRDGSAVYRRVLSAVVNGDEETLTLDSAPSVSAADVAQCCWLDVVRLGVDDVTLEWLTAGVVRVELGLRQAIRREFSGTGDLTGSSSIVAAGVANLSGAGDLTGASSIVAAGVANLVGSGAVAGASSITSSGGVYRLGTGSVAGVSGISAGGAATLFGGGSVAGVSGISAGGAATRFGAGSAAGVSGISAGGAATRFGAGSAAGTSTITASGTPRRFGSGSVAGVSGISAEGLTQVPKP
jgi:hypothetical protein